MGLTTPVSTMAVLPVEFLTEQLFTQFTTGRWPLEFARPGPVFGSSPLRDVHWLHRIPAIVTEVTADGAKLFLEQFFFHGSIRRVPAVGAPKTYADALQGRIRIELLPVFDGARGVVTMANGSISVELDRTPGLEELARDQRTSVDG